MIRHPNFNGMQMNQITRYFTPARFIRTIDASYDGGQGVSPWTRIFRSARTLSLRSGSSHTKRGR